MQSQDHKCQKHQSRFQIFCLDDECNGDRLNCFMCLSIDKKHFHHKLLMIDEFIEGNQEMMESLFSPQILQIQNKDQSYQVTIKQMMMNQIEIQNEKLRQLFDQMLKNVMNRYEQQIDIYVDKVKESNVWKISDLQNQMKWITVNNSQEYQEYFLQQFNKIQDLQVNQMIELINEQYTKLGQTISSEFREYDKIKQELSDREMQQQDLNQLIELLQQQEQIVNDNESNSNKSTKQIELSNEETSKIDCNDRTNQIEQQSQKATQKPKQKSQKKQRDPNAPKKPKCGYMHFCQDNKQKTKDQYPKKTYAQSITQMGLIWSKMSVEERNPYEIKAQIDRERYQREKQEYEKQKLTQTQISEQN